MKRAQVTVSLDIPDVRVLSTEINKVGELIITIEISKEGTICRQCGRETHKRHGFDEWTMIRHLPVFGRPSYLRYRPRCYQCLECEGHPTTTQRLDWRESNSPHSIVYDDHLLLQLVNSAVEDVSLKEGVGYDCVLGVLERRISARSGLRCLDHFLNTLGRWWQEILNYFVNRDNSGFVEGLNNKLKVLKRRCYGLFNLMHLFQHIFLDLEGYRLFAARPPYVAQSR